MSAMSDAQRFLLRTRSIVRRNGGSSLMLSQVVNSSAHATVAWAATVSVSLLTPSPKTGICSAVMETCCRMGLVTWMMYRPGTGSSVSSFSSTSGLVHRSFSARSFPRGEESGSRRDSARRSHVAPPDPSPRRRVAFQSPECRRRLARLPTEGNRPAALTALEPLTATAVRPERRLRRGFQVRSAPTSRIVQAGCFMNSTARRNAASACAPSAARICR